MIIMTKRWSFFLTLVFFLPMSGCIGMPPTDTLIGQDRSILIAQWGEPRNEQTQDLLTHLEYHRGIQTFIFSLNTNQRIESWEQVLDEAHFAKIHPGMSTFEVSWLIGQPDQKSQTGFTNSHIWSYRDQNALSFCRWFEIEFSALGRVKSSGYDYLPYCKSQL